MLSALFIRFISADIFIPKNQRFIVLFICETSFTSDIKRHATEIQTDTLLCAVESHDQGMVKVLAADPHCNLVSFIKSYEPNENNIENNNRGIVFRF